MWESEPSAPGKSNQITQTNGYRQDSDSMNTHWLVRPIRPPQGKTHQRRNPLHLGQRVVYEKL
jgi:hypothetical protein